MVISNLRFISQKLVVTFAQALLSVETHLPNIAPFGRVNVVVGEIVNSCCCTLPNAYLKKQAIVSARTVGMSQH